MANTCTNILIASIILVLFDSCNDKNSLTLKNQDYVLAEKGLTPEGTAFDNRTNTIYVGSIYKQKVIHITPNGVVKDFIGQEIFGDFSPIGMEIDEQRDKLWINTAIAPIVNQSKSAEWKTKILCIDISEKKLIKEYPLTEQEPFFNDLTVASNGDVFATEMANGKIYRIASETDQLALFSEISGFSYPNGITYYEPSNVLFVATNQGILKIDIATEKHSLLKTRSEINAKVIDGLTIYNDFLIGHQSTKIVKFFLNENHTEIIASQILDTGDEFDSSTTGEVGNDFYHYIVNSQIKSGIDNQNRTLKPLDSLENVIVRSRKL